MTVQIVRQNSDCLQVPEVNEPFDLEIDGTLEIAPFGWKLIENGQCVGKKLHHCRLVDLGYCENIQDAAHKVKQQSGGIFLAPGYARQAFMEKYPRHNGRPIVMGGSVWQDVAGDQRVVSLGGYHDGQWSPSFAWSSMEFGDSHLWLTMEVVPADSRDFMGIDLPAKIISQQLSSELPERQRLVVVYRISGVPNNAPRPAWFSKEICLRSFLGAVLLARKTSAVDVILLLDHRSEMPESLAEIINLATDNYGIVSREVTSSGNCGSYVEAVEIVLDLAKCEELILLAEDDYLWVPESISVMVNAFAELSAADYITPYDHPTRYRREFFGGQNIAHWCSQVCCAGERHFRSHETTCMTFMVRSKVLREDEAIHRVYSQKHLKFPGDRELFKALQHLGGSSIRPKVRRLLLGPIPSLATHAHLPLLAPAVDWGKVAAGVL